MREQHSVALLTGRGNNTLKDKNVLEVLGHPILYYPAMAGKGSKHLSSFYCSSDDEKILSAADACGYESIIRPKEMSLPTSQHIECILHGLKTIRERGCNPDILVVILANNVTIKSEWIDECIEMITKDDTVTSVVPVYKDNDHHPYRAKRINESGCLELFEKNVTQAISTNRQDLPGCYFLAHNFWVLRTEYLDTDMSDGQQPWKFMGNKILPYEINESIDIHVEEDLRIAANWLMKNGTMI